MVVLAAEAQKESVELEAAGKRKAIEEIASAISSAVWWPTSFGSRCSVWNSVRIDM